MVFSSRDKTDVMDIKYNSNKTCLHKLGEKQQLVQTKERPLVNCYRTFRAIREAASTANWKHPIFTEFQRNNPICSASNFNNSSQLVSSVWTKHFIQLNATLGEHLFRCLIMARHLCWHCRYSHLCSALLEPISLAPLGFGWFVRAFSFP